MNLSRIQTQVAEIFNLVSLLKPGHLGSLSIFEEVFRAKDRKLENDEYLKELVNKVMIRNRRGDTGIEWPKRVVESCIIEFSEEEQNLYDSINRLRHDPSVAITSQFSIMTLQREACSSREAVYYTVKNMIERKQQENPNYIPSPGLLEIFQKIDLVTRNSKAEKVLELIRKVNDKVII